MQSSLITQATLQRIRDAFLGAEKKAELAASRISDLLMAVDTLRDAAQSDANRLRAYFLEAVNAVVAAAVSEFGILINGPNGYQAELHRHNLVSWWLSHGGGVVSYPKVTRQLSVYEYVTAFPAKANGTLCGPGDTFHHWNGYTTTSGEVDHFGPGSGDRTQNCDGHANWMPVMLGNNSPAWMTALGYTDSNGTHRDSGNIGSCLLVQKTAFNVKVARPDGTTRKINILYSDELPFIDNDVSPSNLVNLPLTTVAFGSRLINVPVVLDVNGAPVKGVIKIIGGANYHGVAASLNKWPVGDSTFQWWSPQAKYKFGMNFYGADRVIHRVPAKEFVVSDQIATV